MGGPRKANTNKKPPEAPPKTPDGGHPEDGDGKQDLKDPQDLQSRRQILFARQKKLEQSLLAVRQELEALNEEEYAESQKEPRETIADALARTSELIKQRRGAGVSLDLGHRLRSQQHAANRKRAENNASADT